MQIGQLRPWYCLRDDAQLRVVGEKSRTWSSLEGFLWLLKASERGASHGEEPASEHHDASREDSLVPVQMKQTRRMSYANCPLKYVSIEFS